MALRFASLLLLSICAFGAGIAAPAFPMSPENATCGLNQEFHSCGTACPPDCANPEEPKLCTRQCVIGCFCKKGYLKNTRGECVLPQECDTPMLFPVVGVEPKCPVNEEFKACGSACAPTCAKPHPSPVCTRNCVIGCFCKEGYLRNGNGLCVPAQQCEPIPTLYANEVSQCKENEIFNECGSACAPTCANPHPSARCTKNCVIGCFCKEGFLKNAQGVCVPADQCEKIPMLYANEVSQCKENEIFNECGSACAPTCANPHPSARCTKNCVIGCFCKEGFLKNAQGVCVPAEQCEKIPMLYANEVSQCKENEIFNECGSACAPTCANPHPGPICTMNCVIGCFCKEGFLKNSQGVCVAAANCDVVPVALAMSSPPQVCGDNEEYRECKGCDGICQQPEVICPAICLPGCACKEGHVRNNGKCVMLRECPLEINPLEAVVLAQEQCSENEEYRQCKGCDGTCQQPNVICPMICLPGCACKEGHVRNNGKCVMLRECPLEINPLEAVALPQVCGDNEEYRRCKGCDGTCKNPLVPCPLMCIPGCACKKDYVRENGRCILALQCPQDDSPLMVHPPVPKCGANEVFHPCGTACPATCANPHPSPVCTRNCVIGCFCQEGYLKNAQGVCVPADKC